MHGSRRTRVENVKYLIIPNREFQIIAGIRPREICDEGFVSIVRRATLVGKMKLPDIIKVQILFQDVECRRRTTFIRAVIHDSDARRNRGNERWTVALEQSV